MHDSCAVQRGSEKKFRREKLRNARRRALGRWIGIASGKFLEKKGKVQDKSCQLGSVRQLRNAEAVCDKKKGIKDLPWYQEKSFPQCHTATPSRWASCRDQQTGLNLCERQLWRGRSDLGSCGRSQWKRKGLKKMSSLETQFPTSCANCGRVPAMVCSTSQVV